MSRLTREGLASYTGGPDRWPHPRHPHLYLTDGVLYLTEAGGAWWLTEAIAGFLGSPAVLDFSRDEPTLGEFITWRLVVAADRSATLAAASDLHRPPFHRIDVSWTDFPLDEVELWLTRDENAWVLSLPSEH